MEAWHFTGDTLRDRRPIPAVGEWLAHEGEIEICRSGLHASRRLIDALKFAPGDNLHRVTMRGIHDWESDKLVARERRIEWSIDAEAVLLAFTRRCALDVLPLWPDAPAVVREYLETGREDIRAAAWATARGAARDAAWDAAWAAAWAAARRDAAWATAWATASWGAAWGAAWSASRAAAGAAAGAAALNKYDGWLVAMVEDAR